jgi:hypothetical protein
MDKSINVILSHRISDSLCAFDMHILKVKVPRELVRFGIILLGRNMAHLVGYMRPTRLYTISECLTLSSRD